jgi:hypothetical protein
MGYRRASAELQRATAPTDAPHDNVGLLSPEPSARFDPDALADDSDVTPGLSIVAVSDSEEPGRGIPRSSSLRSSRKISLTLGDSLGRNSAKELAALGAGGGGGTLGTGADARE